MPKKIARSTPAAASRSLVASGSDSFELAMPLTTRTTVLAAPKKTVVLPGKPSKPAPRKKPSRKTKPTRKPKPARKAKPARKTSRPKKRPATRPARKSGKKAGTPAKRPGQPSARPSKPARRKKVKGRLLWIGDAVVPTGFSTVTHAMLQHLQAGWEVIVSGVNYEGQRHHHPYRIVPARQGRNGDMWGLNNFRNVCAEFAPDVVAINTDWWNVASFVQRAPRGLPIVGYMPVDGANLDPEVVPQLSSLAGAVWYTDFGSREAVKAGFRGARNVIPHGIDTGRWSPVDRALARDLLELPVPGNAFIVGNVNRNQPRKRLDVTIQFFAEWIRACKVRNARLLLHCAKQDAGWDLMQLAKHYGVADRLILTGGDSMHEAVDASRLQLIYSALDVQVSTTLGEGWGLTTMEGMACGIPQIVPDWAALGEWPLPAVKVRCATQLAHPGLNTVGALPDKEAFIAALDRLHRDGARRAKLSRESLAFVRQPQFAWNEVARQMSDVLEIASRKGAGRSTLQRA